MSRTMDYFTGIVELAKAGYKPNDVKELLELAKTNSDNEPSNDSNLSEAGSPDKLQADSNIDKAIDDIIKRERGE